MDFHIVQHPGLCFALMMGLNHIPLWPTDFSKAMSQTTKAFCYLYNLLCLGDYGLELNEALIFLKQRCLAILKMATKNNKFGFRNSGPYLLDNLAVVMVAQKD